MTLPHYKLHPMTGGLHLDTQRFRTLHLPPSPIVSPPQLLFALKQGYLHYKPLVQVGDVLSPSQAIAEATGPQGPQLLHTGLAGIVQSINNTIILNTVSANTDTAVEPIASTPITIRKRTPLELVQHLGQMGVVGLGGASFPTQGKLSDIHTIIVNGVECEPLVTADACLMLYQSALIFEGIAGLAKSLDLQSLYIAIESDKALAMQAMEKHARACADIPNPKWRILPQRYPAGGERQIYEQLFGQRLAPGERLKDKGIACLNVQTVAAIARALRHQPLTHRILTLAGDGIDTPQNYWAPIGTPVKWLLANQLKTSTKERPTPKILSDTTSDMDIRSGGPIMGKPICATQGITAGTNALIVNKRRPNKSQPCIQCNECEPVCPEKLSPVQLIQFATAPASQQVKTDYALDQLSLEACIACGACDLVCPSLIPLASYFTKEQHRRRQQQEEQALAQRARQKYEARAQRLSQPPRPNPQKPTRQKPSASRVTGARTQGASKLKTNLAKAQRLYREAQAALEQAQKKGLDSATLVAYQQRVQKMRDKRNQASQALNNPAE